MSLEFRLPGYHLLWLTFPRHSAILRLFSLLVRPYNPIYVQPQMVWASPISLATTLGIFSFPQGT